MTSCVILAARLGARLDPVTQERPKCLLELHGKPIVRYQLELLRTAGVDPVTIVTG